LKLDDVVDQQRKIIYKKRDHILEASSLNETLKESLSKHLERLVDQYCPESQLPEDWAIGGLYEELAMIMGEIPFQENSLEGLEKKEIQARLDELLKEYFKVLDSLEEKAEFQNQIKLMMLQTLDRSWVVHMELMVQMREGINIRGYGQEDPYRLYEMEGFDEFMHFLAELDAKYSRHAQYYIRQFIEE
jgi:preprotein translocase subunit SecA